MNEAGNKMGERPIPKLLISMSLPPMLSMLIQSLYNIVDSIFVAQYSNDALTAVSLALPLQTFSLAVAVGLGVGLNSYIARKLGERDQNEANNAVTHGLLLSVTAGLVFMALSFMAIRPFFQIFSPSETVFRDACAYGQIVWFFSMGQMVHIAIEKIFQATGSMVFPMVMQVVGAVVNIILDPIFIFGVGPIPELGAAGAAIATIIGQFISMGLSLLFFLCGKHEVKMTLSHFHFEWGIIKSVCAVGFPSIAMNSLGSLLVMGLNSLLVRFSQAAVNVFGVYFKLQTFIYMPVSGLIQGAMPILGYNYGAHESRRLNKTFHLALSIALGIMALGNLLFVLFPGTLLQIFNADSTMLQIGIPALRIISCGYIPAAFGFLVATLFQAMGRGGSSLLNFLLRQFLITLPAAFLLAQTSLRLTGIWLSFPLAEGMAAVVSIVLYVRVKRTDVVLRGEDTPLAVEKNVEP